MLNLQTVEEKPKSHGARDQKVVCFYGRKLLIIRKHLATLPGLVVLVIVVVKIKCF